MLHFVYPWWLLALPLSALPWIWPVLRQSIQRPQFFSTFLLLPKETHHKQFQFSLKDWLLKLLRSLILLLILLLLARPFWLEAPLTRTVFLLDDTPSAQWNKIQQLLSKDSFLSASASPVTLKLSELMPAETLAPRSNFPFEFEGTWSSPNLAQIASALKASLKKGSEAPLIQVHLSSDFQWSQYQSYPLTFYDIDWKFHQKIQTPVINNLGLREVRFVSKGLLESWIEFEIYGHHEKNQPLRLTIAQGKKQLGELSFQWEEKPQKQQIQLSSDFLRVEPVELTLTERAQDPEIDNIYYYQMNRTQNPWIAIMTSEGISGIYRHGLHQLKSALNANQMISFMLNTLDEINHYQPDLFLLLGDHPLRWAKTLKAFKNKLFIPTRLGDWQDYAAQISSQTQGKMKASLILPEDQWRINWTQVSFAKEWDIIEVSELLYYSKVWDLWLLATGISPSWGSLYKDASFTNHLKTWILHLLQEDPIQSLGTFEAGGPLPPMIPVSSSHLKPGHYQVPDSQSEKVYRFSINLPARESLPRLRSESELQTMQAFFNQQHDKRFIQQGNASSEELRMWLLMTLLLLMLVEVFYALWRLIHPLAA
ncbi:BatA domain-containing protein [Deltaproteobacteria bacterium TL4]